MRSVDEQVVQDYPRPDNILTGMSRTNYESKEICCIFRKRDMFFYVPKAYLLQFLNRCWFVNCSLERGGWVGGGGRGEGVRLDFQDPI